MKKTIKDSLGNRMKAYESITRDFLIPKVPTIMRLDGKAFHTYTKQFKRPFDKVLIDMMDETAKYLCSKIQGAKFAYVQSDEITIFISDMDSIESQMWYDGNIQKMTSVSASMASTMFNHLRTLNIINEAVKKWQDKENDSESIIKYKLDGLIEVAVEKMALAEFDSRVFQVPNKEEVVNNFLWRQQDATRNSISAVAQSLYSAKELHKVNTDQMQELIFQKGINWNDYDPKLKRGRFIYKVNYFNGIDFNLVPEAEKNNAGVLRTKWESLECPIFSKDREFLLSKI